MENTFLQRVHLLFIQHQKMLFLLIVSKVRDKELAEDLLHDVFIKITSAVQAGQYIEMSKFLHWAKLIANNHCKDHFRKVKGRTLVPFDREHEQEFIEPVNEFSQVDKARVASLVNDLTPKQRETIVLHSYADLMFKDIAYLTGCSVNTALGRKRYGIRNLRKMLLPNHH